MRGFRQEKRLTFTCQGQFGFDSSSSEGDAWAVGQPSARSCALNFGLAGTGVSSSRANLLAERVPRVDITTKVPEYIGNEVVGGSIEERVDAMLAVLRYLFQCNPRYFLWYKILYDDTVYKEQFQQSAVAKGMACLVWCHNSLPNYKLDTSSHLAL